MTPSARRRYATKVESAHHGDRHEAIGDCKWRSLADLPGPRAERKTPYSRPSRRIPGGLTVRFTTLADRVLEAYEAATRLLTVFNN